MSEAETYGVAAFVADLRAIAAAHDDPREILPAVAPLARELAATPGWVRDEFYQIDESQGIGITVLHEEPDHTLLVEAIVWAPGRGVLPHDHQTWGVVVGLDGVERNTLWLRRDDGTRPGYAELERHSETLVATGQTIGFMPDDIHSVDNDGETPTLSLHIYGQSLAHVARSEFDPAAKEVRPCPIRAKRPANT
jgi:predicted metal-dependent enzyme (double-stranded beta helix superfamily)